MVKTTATEWILVAGCDYEVSADGQVRRTTSYKHLPVGRLLRPRASPKGYLSVRLFCNGKPNDHQINVLVAEAFHGPRPTPAHRVVHLDNDKRNNQSWNLRWDLPRRSSNHRVLANNAVPHARGEEHPGRKLTEREVRRMRKDRLAKCSFNKIAASYAIAVSTAFDAITGKTWGHVAIEDPDLDKSKLEFANLDDHCMFQETLLRHFERRSRKR